MNDCMNEDTSDARVVARSLCAVRQLVSGATSFLFRGGELSVHQVSGRVLARNLPIPKKT